MSRSGENGKKPEGRRLFCLFPDGAFLCHEERKRDPDNLWSGPFAER
ncbi:TPA: DUF91 domain-containing protein [Klebsiella variicola subsp. variicola]|nr:DUF91 domain-containing protein [Klebsiella variicola subsp. variicola]HCM5371439.1 DUF91 domain-containing protein [Klebsiella variicola subsp. variicola]